MISSKSKSMLFALGMGVLAWPGLASARYLRANLGSLLYSGGQPARLR